MDISFTEILIMLLSLLMLVFEFMMVLDAIRNGRLSPTARALWAIGIVLIHPIVAIIYYFALYRGKWSIRKHAPVKNN